MHAAETEFFSTASQPKQIEYKGDHTRKALQVPGKTIEAGEKTVGKKENDKDGSFSCSCRFSLSSA